MLEARAIVVRTDARQAWVEARHDVSGCATCQGKGCGSSKLSQMFCSNKERLFRVKNPIAAQAGDEVVIAIGEGAVLHGVAMVYLLPLTGLLLGGMFGAALVQQVGQRDGYAAFGAGTGLLLGFFLSHVLTRRRSKAGGQAYIARRWQGD
ncbi:SoxR reducing system RseC family protein [Ferriphaselus sp. R-1]|uniref:SoxR reducing system RseC family protein n=1 Tax=Ferriphaselus sp. R-1 TaxID=1485544 RepID=UPI000691B85C|nr:SoxR reducing system RseC family protein [Ferriphaselus sp. R-1]